MGRETRRVVLLSRPGQRNKHNKDPSPMNKLTLQALALTGILAVSGLPALAADMAPAAQAPNPSVSTDSKAKVAPSTSSVDNKAKSSVDTKSTTSSLDKSVDKN